MTRKHDETRPTSGSDVGKKQEGGGHHAPTEPVLEQRARAQAAGWDEVAAPPDDLDQGDEGDAAPAEDIAERDADRGHTRSRRRRRAR